MTEKTTKVVSNYTQLTAQVAADEIANPVTTGNLAVLAGKLRSIGTVHTTFGVYTMFSDELPIVTETSATNTMCRHYNFNDGTISEVANNRRDESEFYFVAFRDTQMRVTPFRNASAVIQYKARLIKKCMQEAGYNGMVLIP